MLPMTRMDSEDTIVNETSQVQNDTQAWFFGMWNPQMVFLIEVESRKCLVEAEHNGWMEHGAVWVMGTVCYS